MMRASRKARTHPGRILGNASGLFVGAKTVAVCRHGAKAPRQSTQGIAPGRQITSENDVVAPPHKKVFKARVYFIWRTTIAPERRERLNRATAEADASDLKAPSRHADRRRMR